MAQTCYAVICYSDHGDKLDSIYSVYTTQLRATTVCKNMNEYEAVNHEKDMGFWEYRVEEVPLEQKEIHDYTLDNQKPV